MSRVQVPSPAPAYAIDYGLAGQPSRSAVHTAEELRLDRVSPYRVFFESKARLGCISLPKDEYENTNNLYLFYGAGVDGVRATATSLACACRFAIGNGLGFGRRLTGKPGG